MRLQHLAVSIVALCLCCVLRASERAADDPVRPPAEPVSAAEQILGRWVLYRDTPGGRYRTVKQHFGDHTVVTTCGLDGKPIQSHRSDYRVDVSGNLPVFRYRNRVILVGPNAGAREDREAAYIFRVDGDRFFEVHGMLPGDKSEPSLLIWERLRENPAQDSKA